MRRLIKFLNTKKSNHLGKDALKLTISKMLTMFISLLAAMLLSRFRSLEEYGTYSQILLLVNITTALFMLGLPNSINYFLAQSESQHDKGIFLSTYYTLSTILSAIVGLVLILTTPIAIEYFNNPYLAKFLYVLAVYPWAKIIISSIENVLIVYKKTTVIIYYRVANSLLILFSIIAVEIFNWTFEIYMLLFIIVEIVFSIIVYLIVSRISENFRILFAIQTIKRILIFSIPIGLATTIGTINIELDKLMIGKFLDTEMLAIYTNASKELPVTIVAVSLTGIILPEIVRFIKLNKHKFALEIWSSGIILSFIVISLFVAGIFTFAPDVITLLYSDKYLEGVNVFRIYAILLLLRCTYFGMILNATGRTKFIFYSSMVSLGLNVVFNYFFFKMLGLIGPAVATLLSQLTINIIQLIFSARIINVTFLEIFPWKKIGIITFVNLVFAMVFYIIKNLSNLEFYVGGVTESIILGIIWSGLYIMLFKNEIYKQWNKLNIRN